MLCSLVELGVDNKYLTESQINGIQELDEDANNIYKNFSYRNTNLTKEYSKVGMMSLVIGVIAWGIFLALSIYSAMTNGTAEKIVGVIGIIDAIFVMFGARVAFKGLQEREESYALAITGIILNGLLFVIYFSLYFMGVSIIL